MYEKRRLTTVNITKRTTLFWFQNLTVFDRHIMCLSKTVKLRSFNGTGLFSQLANMRPIATRDCVSWREPSATTNNHIG
jgi:hypothetical protein